MIKFYTYRSSSNPRLTLQGREQVPFLTPGIFLLLLGITIVLAPGLVLGAIAAFFLFFGGLLLYLGYKFYSLKRKFEQDFLKTTSTSQSEPHYSFHSFMESPFERFEREEKNSSFAQKKSTTEHGAYYTIDGESIEILDPEDLEDPSKASSHSRKEKIIIH
jgi:predicted lipid-binding transport protein (Tim44 family)